MNPLITIGVPVYNEGAFLKETLSSIIDQTFTDFKVIISDNASTDNTSEVAKSVSEQDKRFRYFRQRKNIGAIGNFVFCLKDCTTPYFMWLGGHDLLRPDFLKELLHQLENDPGIVLAYPLANFVNDKGELLGPANSEIHTVGMNQKDRMLKVFRNLSACTAIHGIFRTEIAKSIKWEKYGADNLFLCIASSFGTFYGSDKVLYDRKEIRARETKEQIRQRLVDYQILDSVSDDIQRRSVLSFFSRFAVQNNIPLKVRAQCFDEFLRIVNERGIRLSRKSLLAYFLFGRFSPGAFSFILSSYFIKSDAK